MGEIKLGKYQHYKGNFYEVLGVAKHSETMEDFVVYKSLYDSPEFPAGSFWIRPKEMFLKQVEISGQKIPRFKFIENILLDKIENDIVLGKNISRSISSVKEMKKYFSSL